MGLVTEFLSLFKPSETENYDERTQQNENWDKIDSKVKDIFNRMQVKEIIGLDFDKLTDKIYMESLGFDYDSAYKIAIKSNDSINGPGPSGWSITTIDYVVPNISVITKFSSGDHYSRYGATHTNTWGSDWTKLNN